MNAAATRPPTRVISSGPQPMPEQVVQRGRGRDAVPLADVADEQHLAGRGGRRERPEDRQLAQRTRARRTPRTAPPPPAAARNGIRPAVAARRPNAADRPQRSHRNAQAQHRQHEHAVVARERGEAGQQPGQREGPRRCPCRPRAARNSDAGDQRLVQREVVRLGHVHEGQRRQRGQDARADAHGRRARPRPARSPRRAAPRTRRRWRTAARRPWRWAPGAR